jgi:hypothetical protein
MPVHWTGFQGDLFFAAVIGFAKNIALQHHNLFCCCGLMGTVAVTFVTERLG